MRRGSDEPGDDLRRGGKLLLQVVEHEQCRAVTEVTAEGLGHRALGRLADTDGRGDRGLHEADVPDRREIDEPYPMRVSVAQLARDRDAKAGLAAAARAGQRESHRWPIMSPAAHSRQAPPPIPLQRPLDRYGRKAASRERSSAWYDSCSKRWSGSGASSTSGATRPACRTYSAG